MDIVKQIYLEAKPFKPCRLFDGTETLEELMNLFLTPQGIEFCISNNFPSRDILSRLKEHNLTRMGIHIDGGRKTLKNQKIVVLAGDCDYMLEYNTLSHACKVVLLHGARAKIRASEFSVVKVEKQNGCRCDIEKSDYAIVTMK